ncbi:glucosaminidase domain-containing protein [Cohnella suwonensis]|uniref:Glucosaminidase domain-containing protein n=1 Tax=Cohnella suwonensis TaxID=696072 RepID=A0ABW0M5C2_9BACL
MCRNSFRASLVYGLGLALIVTLGVRAHPAESAVSAFAAPQYTQPLKSIVAISPSEAALALAVPVPVSVSAPPAPVAPVSEPSPAVALSADVPKNAHDEVQISSVAVSSAPPPNTYVVTAYYLNVRASASPSSEVLKVVKKGTLLEIDAETSHGWLALKGEGFVHGGYAEPVPYSPAREKPEQPPQEGAVAEAARKAMPGANPNDAGTPVHNEALRQFSEQILANKRDSGSAKDEGDVPSQPTSKVETDSGLSVADIAEIFEGTALAGHGLEQTVLEVEEEYGINALFTIAVMKLESGNGSSKIAKKKNNLFGLNAISGDAHNRAFSFETKGDSVRKFGQLLSANYVEKGYTTIEKVARKYCPANAKWSGLVKSIMKKDFQKINAA